MWLYVFEDIQKIKNVPELLHNTYIPFFVFVCVCVSVCVSEIIHMGEHTRVCVCVPLYDL